MLSSCNNALFSYTEGTPLVLVVNSPEVDLVVVAVQPGELGRGLSLGFTGQVGDARDEAEELAALLRRPFRLVWKYQDVSFTSGTPTGRRLSQRNHFGGSSFKMVCEIR